SACGRLMAPGTWPRANALGPRTSSRTKSTGPSLSDWCTSQQSFSSDSLWAKGVAAAEGAAAAMSLTWLAMVVLLLAVAPGARRGRATAFDARSGGGDQRRRCQ